MSTGTTTGPADVFRSWLSPPAEDLTEVEPSGDVIYYTYEEIGGGISTTYEWEFVACASRRSAGMDRVGKLEPSGFRRWPLRAVSVRKLEGFDGLSGRGGQLLCLRHELHAITVSSPTVNRFAILGGDTPKLLIWNSLVATPVIVLPSSVAVVEHHGVGHPRTVRSPATWKVTSSPSL